MNTEKKVRLELNAAELDCIYNALNRLCCHYSGKSEALAKISKAVEEGRAGKEWIEPDYWMVQWEKVGRIVSKVYKAQQRINK